MGAGASTNTQRDGDEEQQEQEQEQEHITDTTTDEEYSSPISDQLRKLALGQEGYKDRYRDYSKTLNELEFNKVHELPWNDSKASKNISTAVQPQPRPSIPLQQQQQLLQQQQTRQPPVAMSDPLLQRIGPPPLAGKPPIRKVAPPNNNTNASVKKATQQIVSAPSTLPLPTRAITTPPIAYQDTQQQHMNTSQRTSNAAMQQQSITSSQSSAYKLPSMGIATASSRTSQPPAIKSPVNTTPVDTAKRVSIYDNNDVTAANSIPLMTNTATIMPAKATAKHDNDDSDDDDYGDDVDDSNQDTGVYDWTMYDTSEGINKATAAAAATTTTMTATATVAARKISHDKNEVADKADNKHVEHKAEPYSTTSNYNTITDASRQQQRIKPNNVGIPSRPFPKDGGDPDDSMSAVFTTLTDAPITPPRPSIVPALSLNSDAVLSTPVTPVSQQQKRDISTPTNSKGIPPTNKPSSSHRPSHAPKPKSTMPHAVKETKDVKRNKAQLPSNLTHAKPTTGDWLKKRYIVNNYILLDTLGTGSYAEVRLCKDRTNDTLFAIKIMSKDLLQKKKGGNTTETYFEDIKREIAIMKKLLHPNVLRLYEVLDDPNVNKMYLVLEYMKKGDLLNVIKEKQANHQVDGSMTNSGANDIAAVVHETELWNIFRQVVAGVRYLHYQNIVHGDIKPQNLLVTEDGLVKIADFGISKMLHGSEQKLSDAAGTPAFMSPELCAGKAFSGQLADVWAIGATMYMLMFGAPPFVAGNIINLYNKIQNDPLVFPSNVAIDSSLQELLSSMLIKDPVHRVSLQQVAMHPWLRTAPIAMHRAITPSKQYQHQSLSSPIGATSYHTNQGIASNGKGGDMFQPPASYDQEEAAAMDKPNIREGLVDGSDEIFMSIGLGIQRGVKQKVVTLEEGKDDLMATNWGADVFEMIDDDEDDDGDDDDEDDTYADADDCKHSKSDTNKPSGKDVVLSTSDAVTKTTIERTEMTREEEELRAKRFHKQIVKTSKLSSHADVLTINTSVNNTSNTTNSTSSNTNRHSPSNFNSSNSRNNAMNRNGGTPTLSPTSFSTPSKRTRSSNADTGTPKTLSMEEFTTMMDTLAMQPKVRIDDDEDFKAFNTSNSSSFSMKNSQINAHIKNPKNGVGVAFHSEQGMRESQEDRCILLPDVTKMRYFDNYEWYDGDVKVQLENFTLACVFDGHNGWKCSQYLSQQLAPQLIMHEQFLGKKMDVALINTCHAVDDQICDMLRQENDLAGSTGIIAVYDGRKHVLTVANVGDSMCVLSRSGKAVKLNRMHRLSDEDEKLRVQKTGGTVVNSRVNGILAVSRAFGDYQFKSISSTSSTSGSSSSGGGGVDRSNKNSNSGSNNSIGPVIATPDVYSEVITPMTEFCIIATDGLWDVIAPQLAVNFVRRQLSKKDHDLQAVASMLVHEAIAKGSIDNVTVLIMSFHTKE